MTSTSFMVTILLLSLIGILASWYNARTPVRIDNHPMWVLNLGFVAVFIFSLGVTVLGWDIMAAKYVLVAALLCSVIYVVILAINNFFAKQQQELRYHGDTAFKNKLGAMEDGIKGHNRTAKSSQ